MIQESTIKLLERLEGERYKMYKDSVGKPTTGVGHLIKPEEQYLYSEILTEEDVQNLLRKDLGICEDSISKLVTRSINQNQFDALCSFEFNEGTGALASSTLLKRVNIGMRGQDIQDAFIMWDKIKINGVSQVSPGIHARRLEEAAIYNTPV